MAAYLDQLELVKLMLEEGQGRVLVDGVDAHQATPLMCAYYSSVVMQRYLNV